MPVPGVTFGNTNGDATALCVWDRDGAGPLPPVVVVAGGFTRAGAVAATNVATFDPTTRTWSAMGAATTNNTGSTAILALCARPNGDLVAGGSFTTIGGTAAEGVARWNGTTWQPIGGGVGGIVRALATAANGDLVVAGTLVLPGTTTTVGVARWNGTAWSPAGSGLPGAAITAVLAMPNGDILAGGAIVSLPGPLARFDGTGWTTFGAPPLTFGQVRTLAREANGDVLVGGNLLLFGSTYTGLVRWDGTTWTSPSAWHGSSTFVNALLPLPSGDFHACGSFTVANSSDRLVVARWNGAGFQPIGQGLYSSTQFSPPHVSALALDGNGDLLIGGNFDDHAVGGGRSVARWNGTMWDSLGDGPSGAVRARARLPNGHLVVAGSFTRMGDSAAAYVASFDGAHWSGMGAPFNGPVSTLATLTNGDLVAGGTFTTPGRHVARWNGSAWQSMGLGLTPAGTAAHALLPLPNGELLIAGTASLGIWRWNGSAWSAAGNAGHVSALHRRSDSTVVAAVASGVLSWNGSTAWTQLGFPFDGAAVCFTDMPNGELLVGGSFANAGGVQAIGLARWNGTLWWPHSMNSPSLVHRVLWQPDGDLLAVGPTQVHRWDGAQWSTFMDSGDFTMVAQEENGDLLFGGTFVALDGVLTPSLARATTPCPATATAHGIGCTGSGGANVLVADNRPWLGGTFRSSATGLPGNGLAIGVRGLGGATTPLTAALPQASPGCWLYSTPDLLDAFVPVGGALQWTWPLPNLPALAGNVVFQQVVALDIAGGSLVAATSTNRLNLTLGSF